MRVIEPFAGLGAYSLKALALEHERSTGRACRHEPPVSRMGNKAGFVPAVFKAWGLSRVRWSGVWLNDLDPVCHLFHLIYASSELRDAVARRVWAWVPCLVCLPNDVTAALDGRLKHTREACSGRGREGCEECNGTGVQDARRLWERIRKEPVPMDVEEHGFESDFATLTHVAASAVFLQSRSFSLKPVSIRGGWVEHGDKPEIDERKDGVNAGRIWDDSPRRTVADRLERMPRWAEYGYKPEFESFKATNGDVGTFVSAPRDSLGGWLERLPTSPYIHLTRQDAALCLPAGDASDCLVVLDPPYEGTSGYAYDSARATVLELARTWHEAGALVLIHEAVGLASALGHPWGERVASPLRGRRSSFWAEGGEREWITFNRPPVSWPAEQLSLFGR